MKKKRNGFKDYLINCGLKKEEYESIRVLIWERNRSILNITSLLSSLMGLVFLIITRFISSTVWFPYLFLLVGSFLVFIVNRATGRRKVNMSLSMSLCYFQMLLTCFYAGILSVQSSNYAIPATSIIVFIAVLPLCIDDRPIRMSTVMLIESITYLVISYFFKSRDAFSLDVMNLTTFFLVGMAFYSVICSRNIREIFQGVKVEKIQKNTIVSLATVVEERDEDTGGHIARTEDYVARLIEKMKTENKYKKYDDDYYRNVLLAAPMHDIGKIKIPDHILNKPGKLTEEEFEIMKKHSEYGADIIQKTMNDVEEPEYYEIAYNIARFHHERFDGTGYPLGLKGEDIPLEARMMALADVYDALISERVYKKAFPKDVARGEIEKDIGKKFDPELGKLFLECID